LNSLDFHAFPSSRPRREVVEELRRLLPRLETIADKPRSLPFGLPALDDTLPQGGLAFGALHEVVADSEDDMPAGFGFIAALLGRVPPGAPILFVCASRHPQRCGDPHGHGLAGLGLDPGRVILVETAHETQSLWALEEALRSAVPAAVAGVIGKDLDLKASQRLQLAAAGSGRLLLLLRPGATAGTSAAATRWRLRAASAARDRFGMFARARWHVALERCRSGRPGQWLVEFDHAAHRFSLAAALADTALPGRAGAQAVRHAG